MSSPYLYTKKCAKHGIPVEGDKCLYCDEEATLLEKHDDDLYDSLVRLHKRGKLAPLFGGKVSH